MVSNLNFIFDTQINSNSLSASSLLPGQILLQEGEFLTSRSLCKSVVRQLILTKCSCVPVSPLPKDLKGVKIDVS